jgi:hypothetical protein
MNPEWLTAIGTLMLAAATVALAGVTVWSVKKNNEANKLLREETERLHKREQTRLGKLQALNFISDWADEGFKIIGDKMFSLQSAGPINGFLYKNGNLMTEAVGVQTASLLFDNDFQKILMMTIDTYNKF